MLPQNKREWAFVVFGAAVAVFVAVFQFRLESPYESYYYGLLALVLVATAVILASTSSYGDGNPDAPVDIWKTQRQLMAISGQHMPSTPHLTNASFLYYALVLEEMAETGHALNMALKAARGTAPIDGVATTLYHNLSHISYTMLGTSKEIRRLVSLRADVSTPLSKHIAKQLLDGTTDITVVVAGLALSSGLPAAQAYLEVAESNFSKANPGTGLIDKDAGGKWIKGVNYAPPNLDKVLDHQWSRNRPHDLYEEDMAAEVK